MMIGRRGLMIGGVALTALPVRAFGAALPVPAGNRLAFDVVRNGSKLGKHVLTFEPAGDALTVRIAVDLAYKIGFITLYHYTHRATELWQGGQVVTIQTTTDDNGDKNTVTAHREAAGLYVQGTKAPRYLAPADALPGTHWNKAQLDGPWINTQDGRLMHPKVTPTGIVSIPGAGGGTVRANRYVVSGDVQMETFYDAHSAWAGLAFKKDGSDIRYERQG
jgi:hypothetical protein